MSKVTVDKKTCIGCGLCTQLCPKVFKKVGEKATVIAKAVSGADEACAKNAMSQCPVKAIKVA